MVLVKPDRARSLVAVAATVAAALVVVAPVAAGPASTIEVRATEAVAPCVEAAARTYELASGVRVAVETGKASADGRADVLATTAIEMTRALESGRAVAGSEQDVARIPWVLSLQHGNPLGVHGLADLERPGLEVAVLAGPAAYEARRALRSSAVRETSDARTLRAAPVALVPLSLAGSGVRLPVDVPALEARTAVLTSSDRPEAALAFVRFLASERGQDAFASCGAP
jgi:ABC-type molybdate transport system substrate-binding protein